MENKITPDPQVLLNQIRSLCSVTSAACQGELPELGKVLGLLPPWSPSLVLQGQEKPAGILLIITETAVAAILSSHLGVCAG